MHKKNPKYKQIIAAARTLFWKFGVKRVRVEEICLEANVSKMTFYKFFTNKKELAQILLKDEIRAGLDKFRKIVNSELSFQEKIQQMFIIKLSFAKDISAELISDIYKNQEFELHTILEEMGRESMRIFVDFLDDSRKQGLIRKEVKTEFILAYQANLSQMVMDEALIAKYDKTEDFIMEAMNFLFYGIMSPKND